MYLSILRPFALLVNVYNIFNFLRFESPLTSDAIIFSYHIIIDLFGVLFSVCPLEFPDMKYVADACGNAISNKTGCCLAMESYVTHLQKQSLVTNLQALDCATSLEMKLRKSNITKNVYDLCHISLKDFSLQGL